MTNSSYPSLLDRKARIFASFNRAELTTLACIYLFLSLLKVSGLLILLVSIISLALMKYLSLKLQRGFFKHLFSKDELKWSYKLGGRYE